MCILTLCGSLRARSSNRAVLRAYEQLAAGLTFTHYEALAELPHFNPDLEVEDSALPPSVVEFRASVRRAKAVVISTPEYVHALPGSFKNALDWLVGDPTFAGKIVVILHLARGSTCALDSLREVLRTMSAREIESAFVSLPLGTNQVDAPAILARDELRIQLSSSIAALRSAIRSDHPKGIREVSTGGGRAVRPVLSTSRLVLRQASAGDAVFLLELMNEPAYLEHIGAKGVRTVEDAARYIAEKYTACYERHGYGLYVVETKEEGTPIGVCGLVRRDVLDHPDIGFAYLQRFWSKGYGYEAAGATLAYGRGTLKLPYVYGLVSPKNARSIQLLERLGLNFLRSIPMPGHTVDSHLYGVRLG